MTTDRDRNLVRYTGRCDPCFQKRWPANHIFNTPLRLGKNDLNSNDELSIYHD